MGRKRTPEYEDYRPSGELRWVEVLDEQDQVVWRISWGDSPFPERLSFISLPSSGCYTVNRRQLAENTQKIVERVYEDGQTARYREVGDG